MLGSSRILKSSLLINFLILLYSAYQVKVNDSEWWGYTFIGVFLWTVGTILAVPSDKIPEWYRDNKLLGYPSLSLVVLIVMFHTLGTSGLSNFLLIVVILGSMVELLVYVLQKRIIRDSVLAYYSALVIIAWVFLYKYPLISLTYTLFVVYCAVALLQD